MVMVLLLEMVAPLAVSGAAAARTLGDLRDGDRIVVCTASGMVMLNRDGTPARSPADLPSGFCMFCLPLMHGGADIPAALTALPPDRPLLLAAPFPPSAERRQPCATTTVAAPRAPPAIRFDSV